MRRARCCDIMLMFIYARQQRAADTQMMLLRADVTPLMLIYAAMPLR